ncbi:MAG: ATPase [Cytophagales bacterium CG17_big_fil_post_rev_8_21_14_2_50_40_13]|nr:MAG: ATPase [Cytophagales bacterium CG17_big_fil_post_rev_8_21_14_2_50_40_13]
MTKNTDVLKAKKQIILQGPPGTGKTYTAKDIAEEMIFGSVSSNKKQQKEKLESSDQFVLVQFHPSYSYEDFVRGIISKTNENGNVKYEVENKTLAKFARSAMSAKFATSLSEEDFIAAKYLDYLLMKQSLKESTHVPYYFNNNHEVRLLDVWYKNNYSGIGKLRYEIFRDGSWVMPTWIDIEESFTWENYNNPSTFDDDFIQSSLLAIQSDFIAFVDRLKQASINHVLIIDEINRANLPSVLGELIYALEYRNESVQSIYGIDGDNSLVLPDNLYIIGTMNTADRSVGHIDYAIKRRFAFVDVLPNIEIINNEKAKELFRLVSALFVKEDNTNSEHLASDFDYKDVQLGHSYFMIKEGSVEDQTEELKMRLQYEILPILNEYIKDGILLESAKDKLKEISGFGF